MQPAAFPESNRTLTAPAGQPDVSVMPAWTDDGVVVSKWRPTIRERLALLFGGSVWVRVRSGSTQYPMALGTARPWRQKRVEAIVRRFAVRKAA